MLGDFCLGDEIARVNEAEAKDLAAVLVGVMSAEGGEGVDLMARLAANGVHQLFAAVEGGSFDAALSRP